MNSLKDKNIVISREELVRELNSPPVSERTSAYILSSYQLHIRRRYNCILHRRYITIIFILSFFSIILSLMHLS